MSNIIDPNTVQNIIPHVRIVIDRTCYPEWSVPRRTITDHELVLVISGKGSFTIEEKKYPVQPGMLFYFYPNLAHSGSTEFNPPMRFLAVHFTFAIGKYDGERWYFDKNPSILPLNPVQQLSNWDGAFRTMKKLYQVWTQKIMGYQWKSNILLQHFFYEVIHRQNSPTEGHTNIYRVKQAIDYIKKHYKSNISIQELAAHCGISKGYFNEIFKTVTGITPVEYINQTRIDISKELLLNTSLKIKEIAIQTGFKDEFYFSRVFKKLEGCSPSQFTKKIVNNTYSERGSHY